MVSGAGKHDMSSYIQQKGLGGKIVKAKRSRVTSQ